MADAQASGACGSNTVWVQVPSSARIKNASGVKPGAFSIPGEEFLSPSGCPKGLGACGTVASPYLPPRKMGAEPTWALPGLLGSTSSCQGTGMATNSHLPQGQKQVDLVHVRSVCVAFVPGPLAYKCYVIIGAGTTWVTLIKKSSAKTQKI